MVTGFGSTALLEAAICAKPVIMPHFDEAASEKFAEQIHYINDRHLFDVAYSADDFERLLIDRLNNPKIPDECMKDRYQAFNRYVSSMHENALDKYISTINKVIAIKQTGRIELFS